MDRQRSAPVSQKGTASEKKSKGVAAADDLTLAALKDEVVRNLARDKSKGNNSTAKTSKSESRFDIVRSKEHVETKSSKSTSNEESSTSQKIKSGGRIKTVMKEEGVKASTGKKKNEEHMKTPMKRKRGADWDIVLTYLSSPEKTSSRLRPRKEVPTFRTVNLDENDNDRIVGKRIKVYWSGSRRWFTGHIRGFDVKKRLHNILYEDGDKEELDLKKERFELEITSTEGFNVRNETYSVKTKLGTLDDGEPRADILTKESGKVGVAEKVMSSPEPMKKKSSKQVGKRGRSKSWGKNIKIKKVEDSIAKMDVDVLPEEVDQVMTDEVCDADASGEAHSKKDDVEVKKMGSYYSDSEQTETDDSIEVAKLVKRRTSTMKKAMPTAAKVRSSKSRSREESSQGKKPDEDMEVYMHHDEFKMKLVDGNVNIEETVEVSYQKKLNKTEAFAIEAREKNGEVSCEAQATQLDLSAEKNKICVVGDKVSGDSGDEVEMQKGMENIAVSEDIVISLSSNLSGIKYNMEDVAAKVEVAVGTEIVKDELISGEINVEVPGDIDTVKSNDVTVKRNDEADSVLIAEAEGEVEMQKGVENIAASEDIMISLSSNLSGIKYNMKDVAANVEVAVGTEIVQDELISGEINVEVPGDVDTVKSNDETVKRNDEADSVLIVEAEGEVEIQKGMENIAASEDKMISLSSNLSGIKYNMEDVAANVEVAVGTEIVKDKLISGEINVEVPGDVDFVKSDDETVKRNDEADSVLIVEAEGGCEVSVDLQPSILKNPEENPEILLEKLKTENGGSQEDISKKEVNLTSQKAEEAGEPKSNDNAES